MLRLILRPFHRLAHAGLFMNPFASRKVREGHRRRGHGSGSNGLFGLGLLSSGGRGMESLEPRQLLAFTTSVDPLPVPSMGSLLSDGAVVISAADAVPQSGTVDTSGLDTAGSSAGQQDQAAAQFTVVGGGLLDTAAQAAWNDAVARVNGLLSDLPGRDDYPLIMNEAFGRAGTDVDAFVGRREQFASQLRSAGLGITVELRSADVLQGNRGAYAAVGETGEERIYVNADWVASGASADDIAAVVLEEMGHAIDQRLNPGLDSAGDEGEYFSDLVRRESLAASEIVTLMAEDDHGLIVVDGQALAVEFAFYSVTSIAVTDSADGWYCTGETINVDVTFGGNETVTGTPYVNIVVGSTTRRASYVSGSGTSTLTFSYTAGASGTDSDADGISINANPINLNGGTITNGRNNDAATLTYSSVAANANAKVYNGSRPTLTFMSTLTGATEDTPFEIAYTALTAAGNEANSTAFLIEAVSTGSLAKWNGSAWVAVTAGTTTVGTGEKLQWTPAANANGTLNAFTVKASNGTVASTTAVQVRVTAAAVNDAPSVTSAATVSVAENQTAVQTVTGSDPDAGTTLAYSITGGADAAKFTINSSTGVMAFLTAPDYEIPADSGADNVYDVTVQVSDGTLTASQAVAVTVTNANDAPTLTTIGTLPGATEDTPFEITFATLLAASDATDQDGNAIASFRVEAVSTGTLSKWNGSSWAAVTAGTTTIGTGEKLQWTPAANANGTLNAFTVKASDGTAFSTPAVQVKVTAAAVNDAPTLTTVTALTGAVQEVPFEITYATLLAAGNQADIDGDTLSFRVEAISTGTLEKWNGTSWTAATAGTTTLATGEKLRWTNELYANGTLNAFTVKAYDGALYSATAVQVQVTASPDQTLTGTANADILDGRDGNDTLSGLGGADLLIGGTGADTMAGGTGTDSFYNPTGDMTISLGGSGNSGTISGFDVITDFTLANGSAVSESLRVNASGTTTSIASNTSGTNGTNSTLTIGGVVVRSHAITNGIITFDDADTFAAALTLSSTAHVAAVVDYLRLNDIGGAGTTVAFTATISTVARTYVYTQPGASAPGGSSTAFGLVELQGVTATSLTKTSSTTTSGALYLSDSLVAPTLSTVSTLTGATEDVPFEITYATLLAASNAADVEGDALSFRIEAVSTGTLTKWNGFSWAAVTAGTTTVGTGEKLQWTTAANANGTLNAFTVKAYDGVQASSTAVQVAVTAAAVNDAPSLTTISTLTGATEDTPFEITFATLLAASDATDVEGDAIASFRVEAVSTGTLAKWNGSSWAAVTAGTTIGTGEKLQWTPAANASGTLNAFTVTASDGAAFSTPAVQVKVTAAAVNDAPTLTTVTALTGAVQEVPFEITYATLLAAGNQADIDGDTLSFRVEAISTGTLEKWNGTSWTAATAGTTTLATGEKLRWTNELYANGTLNAFTVKAYDGALYSATAVQVQVTVSPDQTLTGTANADILDGRDGNDTLSGLGGADLLIGGTGADTMAGGTGTDSFYNPTGDMTISLGGSGNSGTISGFDVITDFTLANGSAVSESLRVNASGTTTSIASNTSGTNGTDSTLTIGGAAIASHKISNGIITFDDVNTFASALTLSSTAHVAAVVDYLRRNDIGNAGATVAFTATISTVARTYVYTQPTTNAPGASSTAFGLVELQGVTATSLTTTSSTTTSGALYLSDNLVAPTLTTVSTLTGATEDVPFEITYATLLAASNAADVEGDALSFRIEAVSTGTLSKWNGSSWAAVTAGTTTIGTGEKLQWTTAANANGTLNAFTVKASDGTAFSSTAVQVQVTAAAVNDAPSITSGGTGSVAENASTSTVVYTATSSDVDSGETATYSIKPAVGDAALVSIDPSTGAVTLQASANYEAKTSYTFTVVVTDKGGLTAEKSVTVSVTDVNEAPQVTSGGTGSVAENASTSTVVYTATSSDVDSGETATYSIKPAVGDAALVSIDPSTGAVTLQASANYEAKTSYTFTVVVTDKGGLTAEKSVTVSVTDVNEAPQVTSGGTDSVAENASTSTVVYTATSSDVDSGETATYSIKPAVGDAALVSIDPSTGAVTLQASANYEAKTSYTFTVVVTDKGGLTAEKSVTVSVTDVNEAPQVTSGGTGSVAENASTSTVVYTATSSDVDSGETATYSIKPAVGDAALVSIDPSTGAVTLQASANYEAKTSYTFTVVVTDKGGLTAEKSVTVSVTDVNEAPQVTSGGTGSVAENASTSTVVYTATSSDVDSGETATYSIKPAVGDAALVSIDPSTGAVTLQASANYEAKTSYTFTVVVTDKGGLTAEKSVTVSVTDVNEAPQVTSGGTGSVAENAATSTVVYTATSSDVDSGETATYSIKPAVGDSAQVSIDPSTGEVTLKASANYGVKTSYAFTVVVTDKDGLTAEKSVTVSVTPKNDHTPVFTSGDVGSVGENAATSTVIYTAVATDADSAAPNNVVSYSLKPGVDDAALVSIDSQTGDVTLKASADYETKSSYSFTVVATDGGDPSRSAEKSVTVSVADVNDAPQVTSGGTGSVDENAVASTVIYTATSSDADAGDTATYSIKPGVDDADLVSIDPNTGEVTLKSSADYETKSTYAFTVVVTDKGGLTAEKSVTVSVADVNEAPQVTSGATGGVAENASTSTVIYTATSSDVDAGETAAYSIKPGVDDAGLVSIDPSTGAVTLQASADYETKTSYTFTVVVTDKGGLTAEKSVTVSVTDVNEAPQVTSGATGDVAENAATSTVIYTATSSDVDTGDTATYSIKPGVDDADLVSIDPSTGAVTLQASADYETKTSYTFTVVATDKDGLTAEKSVTVSVTDVNEAPQVTSGSTGSVAENAAASTVIYTATSSDVDAGETASYSIKPGVDDADLVSIDPATGEVTLKSSADHETKSSYAFTVVVTDKGGLTAEKSVTVSVTDVNEAPQLTSGSTGIVAENSPTSTVIYTATSSDVDTGDTATYSIKPAVGDADLVSIDPATGEVTLKASANSGVKASYTFTVVVTDRDGLTAEESVTVSVTPKNDYTPAFTSGSSGSVAENAATSTVIYTAVATDADSVAPNNVVVYSIKPGVDDAVLVSIDAQTGAVTLKASANYETKSSYSFTVVATDGGNPSHSVEQSVTVSVGDVNEAPQVTSGGTGSVDENAAASTVVYTATSSDVDAGETATYSIKPGVGDADLVSMDPTTGEVTLKASANYETKSSYTFTVVVTDKGDLTGEKSVTVAVNNLDEVAPTITSGAVATAIDENSGAGQVVYTVVATDAEDISGGVTYSLKAGADAGLFSIDAKTGAVTLLGDPDYETKPSYSFTVVATDAASHATEKDVTLAINNLDEVAPTITSGAVATAIDENSGAGQVIYTVVATDSEDISGGVTYSLKAESDADAFSIDSKTGAVTLLGDPDYETKPGYTFTVVATDAADNQSELEVTLAINNLDEVPPTIISGGVATAVNEGSGAGQVIYTVEATDSEDISGGVTYSLKAGDDAAFFSIDPQTGEVTLLGNPSYESKPSYTFTVVATDAADNSSEQQVTLAIINLDGVAPTITSGGVAPSVDEKIGAGQVVYTVVAVDSGDVSGGVTFSLKAGEDADAFSIDSKTGEVTLIGNPDYETKPSYAFTVVATDTANNATEQRVTLAINNVDEAAPTITSGAVATAIDENSGAGQVVYTVVATDSGDISGGVSYSLKADGDASAFSIDPVSGKVTLIGNPDYEAKPSYTFTVVATDAASNASEQLVTLAINNLDEHAPVITSGGSAAAIDENSGAGQAVYTAVATDAVESSGGLTYSLRAVGDTAAFAIDSKTGVVTLLGNPDYEAKPSYSFTVVAADDQGNIGEQAVTLAIRNLNEFAAAFTSGGTGEVAEGAPTSTVIYTAVATDADGTAPENVVTYGIKPGVGDAAAVSIEPTTGHVRLISSADLGVKASYTFVVVATDGGSPARSAEQSVTVTVTAMNLRSPVFASGSTGIVAEMAPTSTVAYTAIATDADSTSPNNVVSYGIMPGVGDAAMVAINAQTGAVTLINSADFETKPTYSFTVVATDGGNPANSAEKQVTVTVTNVAASATAVGVAPQRYKAGDTIYVELTFNEPVVVTGAPQIALTVGSTLRQAVYASGSGTAVLRFGYTVVVGENDADGVAVAQSIQLPGGATIKDGAAADASTVLPAASTGGVLVDTVLPMLQSVTGPAARTYASGEKLSFTATFSEPVDVAGAGAGLPYLNLTVNNVTRRAYYESGAGTNKLVFSYTVAVGETAIAGKVVASGKSIQLPAGAAVTDLARNQPLATAYTPPTTTAVKVDGVVPIASSVTAPASKIYRAGQAIVFKVNYSRPVIVTGVPQLTVSIGQSFRQANYIGGSGTKILSFSYTVASGDVSALGVALGNQVALNGGAIRDTVGNPARLTVPVVNTRGVLVDAVPPSITGLTVPTAGTYKKGQTLSFTVTFNEPVVVTGVPKLQATIGTTVRNFNYVRGTGTRSLVFSYTLQATDKDADGIALQPQIVLGAGTIRDNGGTPPTSLSLPGFDTSGIKVG